MAKAMSAFVQNLPMMAKGAVVRAQPKLQTFFKYAKVELVPPKLSELPEVAAGFNNLMKGFKHKTWKTIPVREAWLNTLITMEISFWFFAGECIGKGSLLGYQV